MPRSDNADQNDDQEATGDNAPAKKKKKRIDDNDDDTSSSDETESGESSSYATTLTITGTGSSTSVQSDYSSTDSESTASSNNSYFTARSQSSNFSDESFLTCPEIQTPPDSLSVFCDVFNVSQKHRAMFLPGVRIWTTANSVPRKPKTKSTATLTNYLNNLKKAGIIEPSKRGPFVASLFIIPKQDGQARLIVDYSNLTPILKPPKFYLPSIYQLLHRKHIPCKNPFFVKIDLKNAFYNIAIHKKSRYLTTFWYEGRYYRFKYLPFGISIAPFFMQMMSNYIVKHFTDKGLFSWVHLDDLIVISDDPTLLQSALNEVLFKLMQSNILINHKKSVLIPTQEIEFLGAKWNKDRITRLPKVEHQIIKIINFISHSRKTYSLKKAQQIAGYLNYYLAIAGPSIYKVVTFYLHNYDNFERAKEWWSLAVRKLLAIKHMIYNKRQALEACSTVETVHVDASLTTACSFFITNQEVVTEPTTYTAPIYVAETHAAFLDLKQIFEHAVANNYNKTTTHQLFTDNCIVYFMINRGRSKAQYINSYFLINFLVFYTLLANIINIEIFFVPSADNLADQFTR